MIESPLYSNVLSQLRPNALSTSSVISPQEKDGFREISPWNNDTLLISGSTIHSRLLSIIRSLQFLDIQLRHLEQRVHRTTKME